MKPLGALGVPSWLPLGTLGLPMERQSEFVELILAPLIPSRILAHFWVPLGSQNLGPAAKGLNLWWHGKVTLFDVK